MRNVEKRVLTEADRLTIPAHFVPAFRTDISIGRGVERNLLFKTWGGLGDQICAEPTLRYALSQFRNCNISLASEAPSLFRHLKFKKVFDTKEEMPIWQNYLTFDTITPPDDSNLVWQFVCHMITNCVDFPSLCALRCQLPVRDREIFQQPQHPSALGHMRNCVFVHAGRHWPSKTFPAAWWNSVLCHLKTNNVTPILIGGDTDDNRGTVEVNADGCIDLRNKLSISDSIWMLQRAAVLLTNDSSPLHMAASRDPDDESTGHCWIGFIATCKHPDYISHFRHGQWSYREKNLGLGGIWEEMDHCPNKGEEVTVDKVDSNLLRSWLPDPSDVVAWALERLKENGHHTRAN